MHEVLIIVTDVRGVCHAAAARAVYAACRVRYVILYSLRQMPLASGFPCALALGSLELER